MKTWKTAFKSFWGTLCYIYFVIQALLLDQFSILEIESKEFFLKGLDFINIDIDIVQTRPRISPKFGGSKKKT